MDAKVIENERTAMSQHMTRQPDGPGKRIGKKGRFPASARSPPAEQNCSVNDCHKSRLRPLTGKHGSARFTTFG